MAISSVTVTVMPPGFTVSVPSVHAPSPLSPPQPPPPPPPPATAAALSAPGGLLTLSATVVLWPEASVPAAGDTVTCPTRLEDSVTDQSTVPNEAFRVSVPPPLPSTIVVGVTVRMPRDGGELEAVVALLVAGAGEVGLALALDGGGGVGWDGGAEVGWEGVVL